ncbi:hypothetical protein PIIN_04516 [Serendipita indica DSM 11827]|uniref:Uncharacterized protein n=1 Tax=Serendipita indica (strain DSM 11827) TaxID=1109443 RepID=G4TGY5_SERID|nr:hypothetical protein PIIN_04516 [Serendipita indica DSM 11827]
MKRGLRLERKWSGAPEVDPSPIRRIVLDTTQHHVVGARDIAVTWIWFLDDGKHVLCVIDDRIIQLWNIPVNRMLVCFFVGGELERAAKHIVGDHILIAGSVSLEEDGVHVDRFRVWKLEINEFPTEEEPTRLIDIIVPQRTEFTMVTDTFAGAVYLDSPSSAKRSDLHPNYSDDLHMILIDLDSSSRYVQAYTPLRYFDKHETNLRMDHFRITKSETRMYVHITTGTMDLVTYAYDFQQLAAALPTMGPQRPKLVIKPYLLVHYSLPPHLSALFNEPTCGFWGDSCLWNRRQIGMFGAFSQINSESTINELGITLSVLGLDHEDQIATVQDKLDVRHEVYDMPVIYVIPEHYIMSRTPDAFVLVGQPKKSRSVAWAMTDRDSDRQITTLAISHFSTKTIPDSGDEDVRMRLDGDTAPPHPMDHHPSQVSMNRGQVILIDTENWILDSEEIHDMDLDDFHGRVGVGAGNGKALILEFV